MNAWSVAVRSLNIVLPLYSLPNHDPILPWAGTGRSVQMVEIKDETRLALTAYSVAPCRSVPPVPAGYVYNSQLRERGARRPVPGPQRRDRAGGAPRCVLRLAGRLDPRRKYRRTRPGDGHPRPAQHPEYGPAPLG